MFMNSIQQKPQDFQNLTFMNSTSGKSEKLLHFATFQREQSISPCIIARAITLVECNSLSFLLWWGILALLHSATLSVFTNQQCKFLFFIISLLYFASFYSHFAPTFSLSHSVADSLLYYLIVQHCMMAHILQLIFFCSIVFNQDEELSKVFI